MAIADGDSGRFWNPPVFWPAPNVATYTDLLVGSGPLHWPWRLLGIDPDLAQVGWLASAMVLSFLLFRWFLARELGLGGLLPAVAGAWLFTFGGPRVASIVHPQLQIQVWWLVAFFALHRWASTPGGAPRHPALLPVAAAAVAFQAWTAFYPFFFFGLLVALAAALSLALGIDRGWPSRLLQDRASAASAAVVGAAILAPLVARYLETLGQLGGRPWGALIGAQPRPASWILPGPRSALYGWLYELAPIAADPDLLRPPHANGFGLLTTLLATIGLWRSRRLPLVRLLVSTALAAMVLTTLWPGGFSLWRFVHAVVPGAEGIRAVGRIGGFLLLPAAIGLAVLLRDLGRSADRRVRSVVVPVLLLGVVAEQIQLPPSWSREKARDRVAVLTEALASFPEGRCESFLVAWEGRPVPTLHEDAMRTAIRTGIPTLNGRYGNAPVGWELDPARWNASGKSPAQVLFEWIEAHGLDGRRVCTLAVSPTGEESMAVRRVGDAGPLVRRPADG